MRTWKKTALVLGLVLPMALFVTGVATSSAQDPSPTAVESPAEAPAGSPAEAPAEAASDEAAPEAPKKINMAALKQSGADLGSSWGQKFQSLLGMAFLLGICVVFSNNRRRISWRLVGWGLGLQLAMGVFVMKTDLGAWFFSSVNGIVDALLSYTTDGAAFLFGSLAKVSTNNPPVGIGSTFGGPVEPTGEVVQLGAYFAFGVLPTIIFFSSLMAVLYHAGVMQMVVKMVATVMQKTMGTSGAETLAASGNIFVGQTESPLLIRPFVKGMTESELMAVMTCGFATVAGGVMAAYVGMLRGSFEDIAGHLMSASVMSAPAALVCAKLLVPEPTPEKSETYGEMKVELKKVDANLIDAAARGAGDGLQLALNVGAMLLAFLALVAMANGLLGWGANRVADVFYGRTWEARLSAATAEYGRITVAAEVDADDLADAEADLIELAKEAAATSGAAYTSITFSADAAAATIDDAGTLIVGLAAFDAARPHLAGLPEPQPVDDTSWESGMRGLTLEAILGFLLAPLAWLMGVPWEDAGIVGQLIGVKTILNEFVAYGSLSELIPAGALSHPRSVVISTYALCGFANLGSIAIQIGGIGGIAPERRSDLAKLGLKAMIAGNIGCLLTATVAGLLV
jgi:CNT family concentrative nucleoside transporter